MSEIKGARELARRMERMGRELGRAVDGGLLQAAEHTARAARELAPVRTGRLRESIYFRGAAGEAAAGAACSYAATVELGTLRSPAQPFLAPAAAGISPAALAGEAAKEVLK